MDSQNQNPSAKIEKPDTPSWLEITVVPEIRDSVIRTPKGNHSKYKVVFSLGVPLNLISNSTPHIGAIDNGDSHLYIQGKTKSGENVVYFKISAKVNNRIIEFTAHPNQKGFLSSFECEIEGDNFRNAANSAYKIISPSLSQMSFQNNVPIFISSVAIMELTTGSSRIFFLSDGKRKSIKRENAFSLDSEIRAYLAMYREAQNANTSTFYQLFCYFKIIDGINKNRGLEKGKITIFTQEVVPDKYVHKGKKFSWVKNLVSKQFRNELAHFNFADGNLTMNPDDMDNLFECVLLLHELQYIARTMIENEMFRKKQN